MVCEIFQLAELSQNDKEYSIIELLQSAVELSDSDYSGTAD